jgi:hypothetical protein
MSRGEIDALVARQLRAKRPQGKSQLAFITVVVYAFAAATVLYWLHVDPRTHWFVPILLVAIEVGILPIFWPRISLEAHLRAIQITGDAEAHISLLAELSRLNKTRLDEALLRRISNKHSVSPERLQALTQPHVRPVQDRYPIADTYFKAGV